MVPWRHRTNSLSVGNAPGAMMVDGNILLDLAPIGGGRAAAPCFFYEYNYVSNTFTQVGAPGGGSTYDSSPFRNQHVGSAGRDRCCS